MFDVQSLLRYTKLSQRELGRILGVSESAITKAKQGKMNWPDEWTAILSKKLNLDLSRFELDDLNMANEPYTTYNKSLIQRIEGKFCVVLFSKKTQTKSVIPIFPDAKNVLDKYSDNLPKRPSGQKFNDMVKEVCRLSGITQQVQISKLQGADVSTKYWGLYGHAFFGVQKAISLNRGFWACSNALSVSVKSYS